MFSKTITTSFVVFIFSTFFLLLAGSDIVLSQETSESTFKWYNLDEAQELARSDNKKVFVFAEAEWCSYCKQMKREIFPKKEVQGILSNNYYPVKIDIESEKRLNFNGKEMTEREFSKQMKLRATPTMIFLDDNGEVMGVQPGYLPENKFLALLEYVVSENYGKIKFEEYLEKNN
jgi:thioredoxin-related protein